MDDQTRQVVESRLDHFAAMGLATERTRDDGP